MKYGRDCMNISKIRRITSHIIFQLAIACLSHAQSEQMNGNGEGPEIGIDLGTTYSCVGVWRNGRVEIIANEHGNPITSSVVAFSDKELLIGESAENQVARNPHNTVFDAKRFIGRKFSDACVQSNLGSWPFNVIPGAGDKPIIVVTYKGEEKHFADVRIDLFKKCMETVEKCLRGAKMDKSSIHDVILVGRSTMIPRVQSLLQGTLEEY